MSNQNAPMRGYHFSGKSHTSITNTYHPAPGYSRTKFDVANDLQSLIASGDIDEALDYRKKGEYWDDRVLSPLSEKGDLQNFKRVFLSDVDTFSERFSLGEIIHHALSYGAVEILDFILFQIPEMRYIRRVGTIVTTENMPVSESNRLTWLLPLSDKYPLVSWKWILAHVPTFKIKNHHIHDATNSEVEIFLRAEMARQDALDKIH